MLKAGQDGWKWTSHIAAVSIVSQMTKENDKDAPKMTDKGEVVFFTLKHLHQILKNAAAVHDVLKAFSHYTLMRI